MVGTKVEWASVFDLRLPEHAKRPCGPEQTLSVRTETLKVACIDIEEERKKKSFVAVKPKLDIAKIRLDFESAGTADEGPEVFA